MDDLSDLSEDDSLIVVRVLTVRGQLVAETDASISPRYPRVVADQLRQLADSLEDDNPERPVH